MSVWFHADHTVPAALSLLPTAMDTPEARALVLAIGVQESGFRHRRQHDDGPARGFWQFEEIAVTEVLTHHATAAPARRVCELLGYPASADAVYAVLAHQDVLAAACARLLLWRLPKRLPRRGESDLAWDQYCEAWRPGRPRPVSWPVAFALAWGLVE